MRRGSVWAPGAGSVSLRVGDRQTPMRRRDTGWWEPTGRVGRGTEYGFIVDGEGPLPDPRSQWQPAGVHGLSRMIDHGKFRWHDQGWQPTPITQGVLYELHVGTFSREGTFEAVIPRLDYLVDLGITHLELMPVHQFPGERGWGYDAAALYAAHAAYGGPIALKRLVDACHASSLAVILDVVYNHLGPEGNYLPRFGPYLTGRYGTLWGQALNLDGPGSDEVRRFICDNAVNWLRDYHLDGLRLDAVHGFIDMSARPLLEQIATEVTELQVELGRPLVLIAESNQNDPRIVRPTEVGGMGLDLMWNDDFHHALHVGLTAERDGYYGDFDGIGDLGRALEHGFVYGGYYAVSRESTVGRQGEDVDSCHLVAYLQNHDQVGNRALGERISTLTSSDLAKVGAAILLMAPFVPMIFQGQEWGSSSPFLYFTDLQDPRLGRAVRQGRRREFSEFLTAGTTVPDPQSEETFQRSKLNWDELGEPTHRELLAWHRDLIRLRRGAPELWSGGRPEVAVGRSAWLVFRRGPIQLAANFSCRRRRLAVLGTGARNGELLLTSRSDIHHSGESISLPPHSVAIFSNT